VVSLYNIRFEGIKSNAKGGSRAPSCQVRKRLMCNGKFDALPHPQINMGGLAKALDFLTQ
jgi:hypothetical protein